MRRTLLCCALAALLCCLRATAQEARSGVDVRATVSGQLAASSFSTETPRSGSPITAGYRAVVYPTIKFNDHFAITAALQSNSHPYFYETLTTKSYGIKDNVLQAALNYSRVSDKGSLLVRAGVLSTAFGSFLLHYDDADNALVDLPLEYGYYYKTVSSLGIAGAQIDATRGKWDGRVQFANSSPTNPRSIFARDQYGNWAGGAGYTARQGLRFGVSAYRGPFLNRTGRFFFPGEANPSTLPAHAIGVDVGWARGHWNLQGEWQTFTMPYKAIQTFHEDAGYVEAKRVVNPRWYVAARSGYTSTSSPATTVSVEGTAGFRPNRLQVIKVGYEFDHHSTGTYRLDNTVSIQIVTSLHLFSIAGK